MHVLRKLMYVCWFVAPDLQMSPNAFEKGLGVHGRKPDPPSKSKVGIDDPLAVLCGLQDKFQLEAVQEYLWVNGQNTLKDVRSYTFRKN